MFISILALRCKRALCTNTIIFRCIYFMWCLTLSSRGQFHCLTHLIKMGTALNVIQFSLRSTWSSPSAKCILRSPRGCLKLWIVLSSNIRICTLKFTYKLGTVRIRRIRILALALAFALALLEYLSLSMNNRNQRKQYHKLERARGMCSELFPFFFAVIFSPWLFIDSYPHCDCWVVQKANVSCRHAKLFSRMAVPHYVPINDVWKFAE